MSNDAIDFSLLAQSGAAAKSFRQGDVIFKEGDPATELYVIRSGSVQIMHRNRLLDTLSVNSVFGEMALIDAAPRSATAVAASDVTVVPVSEKQFLFMVSQTPFFALTVMRVLARRLRAMNDAI